MCKRLFAYALTAVLGMASPTVAQDSVLLDYFIQHAAALDVSTKRSRILLDLAEKEYQLAVEAYQREHPEYQPPKIGTTAGLKEASDAIKDAASRADGSTVAPTETASATIASADQPMVRTDTPPDTSRMDDFQSTERHESVPTMLEFLERAAHLKPAVRENLLQARLLNTILHIDPTAMPDRTTSDVVTSREDRVLLRTIMHPVEGQGDDVFVVHTLIEPNTELRALMRVRDEYNEYVEEESVYHGQMFLFLSGRVASGEWKTQDRATSWDGHVGNLHSLTLRLDEYNVEKIRTNPLDDSHTCTVSVQRSARLFERMTVGWVRYYMGKEERPGTHVCLQ